MPSNGEALSVDHPENAMLTNVNLYVYDPESNRVSTCALLHIANLEHVETSEAR
ncbi:MAG: hypothetical protein AB7U20_08065 [Planctomycetaceae bacterium]